MDAVFFFNDVKGLLLPIWLLAAGAAAAQAGILIGGSFWRAAFRDSFRALGELGALGILVDFGMFPLETIAVLDVGLHHDGEAAGHDAFSEPLEIVIESPGGCAVGSWM